MPLVIDPDGAEIRALQHVVRWKDRDVLELGCGEGRLTLRLAAFGPRHIDALDAEAGRLRRARGNRPAALRSRITYRRGDARRLNFRDGRFDVTVFSWSL